MLVTDAQIHIWEVDRPDRPWPQPPRNRPQREGGFSAEEALAAMDEAGVDRAVIVPPTWVGENNATALEAVTASPGRFAVMGRFDPDAPDALPRLEQWLSQRGMLGIRLTFNARPRWEQLDDGSLEWFWSACERLNVPLMLLLRGRPEVAASIAGRHPGLTLILDHMALDLDAEGRPEAWGSFDRLLALARSPRVFVKVSSAPNFSAEAYPHRDIHPYLERLHQAFGPERLFWGADFTRLKGSYRDCVRLFNEGLGFLSEADRELVLGQALSRCLRWPEKPSSSQ